MDKLLSLAQIAFAIGLMVAILLQNRGGGLSGFFGGASNVYATKRGLEQKLFYATIAFAVLFFGVSLAIVIR